MRIFAYPIPYQDPAEAFAGYAGQRYSLLFDSARPGHPLNHFSYICAAPFETIESKNGRVTVTNAEQQLSFDADAMDTVKERISAWGEARDTRYDLPPFQGGAAGFFGYDLARQMEHLPQRTEDSPSLPDMCIGLYDKIMSFDTTEKKAWVVIRAKHEGEAEKKRKLLSDLSFPAPVNSGNDKITWEADCDEDAYKTKVQKVIE